MTDAAQTQEEGAQEEDHGNWYENIYVVFGAGVVVGVVILSLLAHL